MSGHRDGSPRPWASEQEELRWLRSENALLRVENDMLRRIATEYALDRGDPAVEGSSVDGWPTERWPDGAGGR